jgi:hypothetical protein
MARKPCHSATADGDEVFPRRGRERMVGEPPHAHGDGVILTVIQLASSGWRGSHATARQREDSDRFLCSQAKRLVVEQRSIGRVFHDRVKVKLFGAV